MKLLTKIIKNKREIITMLIISLLTILVFSAIPRFMNWLVEFTYVNKNPNEVISGDSIMIHLILSVLAFTGGIFAGLFCLKDHKSPWLIVFWMYYSFLTSVGLSNGYDIEVLGFIKSYPVLIFFALYFGSSASMGVVAANAIRKFRIHYALYLRKRRNRNNY